MSEKEKITIEKKNMECSEIFYFRINEDVMDEDWKQHFTHFLPSIESPDLYFLIDNSESRDAITLDGLRQAIILFINANLSKVRIALVSPNRSYSSMGRLFNLASENENFDARAELFLRSIDAENWLIKQINK